MDKKVKCCSCEQISLRREWKGAKIIDGKQYGGCPHCNGEWYTEVDEK